MKNAYLWEGNRENITTFFKKISTPYVVESSNYLYKNSDYVEKRIKKSKKFDQEMPLRVLLLEEIKSGISSPMNIEFAAVVYFIFDQTAIQFFGVESFPRLEKVLSNYPLLEDYSITDNLSDDVLEERKEFWSFVKNPQEDGLSYEFHTPMNILRIVRRYKKLHEGF